MKDKPIWKYQKFKVIKMANKKEFVVVKKANCPICGKEMREDEDETVWRCHTKGCPVQWVQIADNSGNPITDEEYE